MQQERSTPPKSHILLVMRGYPGTGKSTVARALATALQATVLDRDIIRQVAVTNFGNAPTIGRFSYELVFALAWEQLQLGLSVVIDTPLTYRVTYEQALALAHTMQVPMLVVHCHCSPEVQRQRLEERKGRVSPFQITSWEDWEQWKQRFEVFEDNGITIDTERPLEDSLQQVLRAVEDLQKD